MHLRMAPRSIALVSTVALSLLLTGCGDHDDGASITQIENAAQSSTTAQRESDTLPYYDSAEMTPRWLASSAKELKNIHTIPAFSFTNQDGKEVTNAGFDGKIYVASFFFASCPGICSTVNLRLRQIQDEFSNDDRVRMLSHSITPEADTVEELHAYAKKHEIQSSKWDLVTGDRSEIYRLARQGYFADEDLGKPGANGDFLHTDNIMLIDQNGRIRGVYSGMSSYAMFNLTDDIKKLEKELPTT